MTERSERAAARQEASEVGRALAAMNASILRDMKALTIEDIAAFQKQIESTMAPLLSLQAEYSRLVAQFDVSRVLVANLALERLGVDRWVFNHWLMARLTFPAQELAEQITRALAPSAEAIAEFQRQFRLIAEEVNAWLWPDLEPLRQAAARVARVHVVRDAFVQYGLWLTPSMSEEFIQKIVALHGKGASSATANSVVSRYFAKDNWRLLDSVVNRYRNSPALSRRAVVIAQALEAHRQGLYAVTVPALLMQVEGIAADYVKTKNLLPKMGGSTKQIIVAALENCSVDDVRTQAGVAALLEYIENSMYVFVDFDEEHQRLLRQKRLNAHAIRHGRQMQYGLRMNSLRLFLMVDTLSLLQ